MSGERRLAMRGSAGLLGLGVFLLPLRSAYACPSCQEAVPQTPSSEELDQVRLAKAYNNSILLMVGMPYLLLGGVGFLVYRGLRQKAALERARLLASSPALDGRQSDLPGGSPCSPSSPVADS